MERRDEYEIKEVSHCLECGSEIEHLRKGKKFCDDRCRSNYHNREKNKVRHYHSKVTGILEKNYCILVKLYESGKRTAELSDLTVWGFNAEYATGYRKVGRHNEFRCYEFRYHMTPGKICSLERTRL